MFWASAISRAGVDPNEDGPGLEALDESHADRAGPRRRLSFDEIRIRRLDGEHRESIEDIVDVQRCAPSIQAVEIKMKVGQYIAAGDKIRGGLRRDETAAARLMRHIAGTRGGVVGAQRRLVDHAGVSGPLRHARELVPCMQLRAGAT